jgi:hypothetical protein
MTIEAIPESKLLAALRKHGSPSKVVLHEHWECWGIVESMRLLALMAREIAANEVARVTAQERAKDAPPS